MQGHKSGRVARSQPSPTGGKEHSLSLTGRTVLGVWAFGRRERGCISSYHSPATRFRDHRETCRPDAMPLWATSGPQAGG